MNIDNLRESTHVLDIRNIPCNCWTVPHEQQVHFANVEAALILGAGLLGTILLCVSVFSFAIYLSKGKRNVNQSQD